MQNKHSNYNNQSHRDHRKHDDRRSDDRYEKHRSDSDSKRLRSISRSRSNERRRNSPHSRRGYHKKDDSYYSKRDNHSSRHANYSDRTYSPHRKDASNKSYNDSKRDFMQEEKKYESNSKTNNVTRSRSRENSKERNKEDKGTIFQRINKKPSKSITELEALDYPFCKYEKTEADAKDAFLSLQKYSLHSENNRNDYRKPIAPSNGMDINSYWNIGFLSDYFNQEIRVKLQKKGQKMSPFEHWSQNKKEVLSKINRELSIKEINNFLFTRGIDHNVFNPNLLPNLIRRLGSVQVLDISSGSGSRLICSLAARTDYIGIESDTSFFPSYKKILESFGSGSFEQEEPMMFSNRWNKYKLICAKPNEADIGTYTCDLLFIDPTIYLTTTDSAAQSLEIKGEETEVIQSIISRFGSRVRQFGYVVLLQSNIQDKKDQLRKTVEELLKRINPDFDYVDSLGYGPRDNWTLHEPVLMWRNSSKEKLNNLYYIGSERCEMINVNSEEELERDLNQKITRIDQQNKRIYLNEMGEHTLDFGTVLIGKESFEVVKYVDLNPETLNPKLLLEKITIGSRNFHLVADNVLPGGTKQRGSNFSKVNESEIVYAGPHIGCAQVAMALGAKVLNKNSTMFLSKADTYTTLRAMQYGMQAQLFADAPLKVLQEKASEYVKKTGAHLVPFGFNWEEFKNNMTAGILEAIRGQFDAQNYEGTVWVACGSATLINSLYKVFPKAKFGAVQVGKKIWDDQIEKPRTTLYIAPETFYEAGRVLPPYSSPIRYDAKVWQFVEEHGKEGDLIWNVAN